MTTTLRLSPTTTARHSGALADLGRLAALVGAVLLAVLPLVAAALMLTSSSGLVRLGALGVFLVGTPLATWLAAKALRAWS